MNRLLPAWGLFAVLLLVAPNLVAASIGRVTLVEGDASLTRNGKPLEAARLAEGLELETDDSLTTGPNGKVELILDKAGGVPASLSLGASTSLSLDITALKREQAAAIEFIGGSLAVKLTSVSGSSSLEVRTGIALLSTRSATFRLMTALGGELAVSTSAGRVQCLVGELSYQSEPGAVVVITPDPLEGHSLPANASTLDSWNQTWKAGIDADIRNRALQTLQASTSHYLQTAGQLQRTWDRWLREGSTVAALWAKQDETGAVSSAEQLVLEKKTVGGLAVALRRQALALERDSFRLVALRSRLLPALLSESQEVAEGYTLKDFYRQFDRDQASASRLATARWLHKAYLRRNFGDFPSPRALPEVTRESPFFN
ncbi:MAG: hypothetical protein WCG80_12135 [Spirochaetales bacterium]